MELIISNINIALYIFAWLLSLIIYLQKRKRFGAGGVIISLYLLFSIMSLLLYNSSFYSFNEITLFPFVYLFFMIRLVLWPILKYDNYKIIEIQKPNNLVLNIFCVSFIFASLIQLPSIISDFQINLLKLLYSSDGGQELYNDAMSNSFSSGDGNIANLASIVSNAYGNLGILLLFYYLTLKKKNKIILIGLFVSSLISFLINISLGQRGPIVETILSMVVTYYALRSFYSPSINKIIRTFGYSLLISIGIVLIALTNSRFKSNDGGSIASIYFYSGQENLYFNNFGLDNGGIRYGDRVVPLFKRMIGFENVPNNFWERREKYRNLYINDEVFIGFIGDFTLDFGPIISIFILIIFTFIVFRSTKIYNGRIKFHQLILIHFVICLCTLGGMKLHPFSDVGGNLQLIMYFLAFIIFRFDYESISNRNKKSNIVYYK